MNELRSAAIPTPEEARGWIGERVEDIHGKSIGRLADIWSDPATKEPIWLLVRFGSGSDSCTLIPLREAWRAPRRVCVRIDREFVRGAPWIHRYTPLSVESNAAFAAYYGVRLRSQPRRFPAQAPAPTAPERAGRFRAEQSRPRRRAINVARAENGRAAAAVSATRAGL